ncbi:MAG TPA: TetR/AcrR family transcriptional regulator [Caulobacteraceae bacterium]|jgi:AcrR family transcriptional regulator
MSLRERKKLATRNALIQVARKLFAEKGYRKTTLEDICEQVPIHVTTFFSYFESKEELAFAKTLDALESLRALVRERPPNVDVITTYWNFYYSFDLRVHEEEREVMFRNEGGLVLKSRYAAYVQQKYETEMARALAEEAGRDPETDLYSRICANILFGTLVAGGQWLSSQPDQTGLPSHTADVTQLILSRLPSRAEIEAAERKLTGRRAKKSAARLSRRKQAET